MCGLAGVFFRAGGPADTDLRDVALAFTRLLAISEIRGTHAAGVALLDSSGGLRILKKPVPASRLVREVEFRELMARVSTDTTLVMGHARWATRGNPMDNSNNQPLRTGDVLGTHNGTILNADELFDRFGFRRDARVDSELLFRCAADSLDRKGVIDDADLADHFQFCRGQMSVAIASRLDPGRLLLFRGNRPLQARYDERRGVLLYASEALFLDAALAGEPGWRVLPLPPMHYLDVRAEEPGDAVPRPFRFEATGRNEPVALGEGKRTERASNQRNEQEPEPLLAPRPSHRRKPAHAPAAESSARRSGRHNRKKGSKP